MNSTIRKYNFQEGEVLLIDKPLEWTSFDVVNKLRYAIKNKLKVKKIKVGHAGTLDPLATGLLIICTGKKTKTINELMSDEKEYTGKIQLGATTPSYDLETEINERFSTEHLTFDKIKVAMQSFEGEILQTPPLFSAKKIDGKRAYEHARKGENVVLKKSPVHIKLFELVELDENRNELCFRVICSKGTYIRSLANDLGEQLNCGGYLSELRRTRSGIHEVKNALSIDQMLEEIRNQEEL